MLPSNVESAEECRTSGCSIYAYGCSHPWVLRRKIRCYGHEVRVNKKMSMRGMDDGPFVPMYKFKCCKKTTSFPNYDPERRRRLRDGEVEP